MHACACLSVCVCDVVSDVVLLVLWIFQTRILSGVGCRFLLQGIFQTQGSNLHLMSPALAEGFFSASATWEGPDGLGILKHNGVVVQEVLFTDTAEWMLFTFLPTTQHSSP